jgi:hypothetical protein
MTNELRKALIHQKKTSRQLAQRNQEIANLKDDIRELDNHAAAARKDLAEKDNAVQVRLPELWYSRLCLHNDTHVRNAVNMSSQFPLAHPCTALLARNS